MRSRLPVGSLRNLVMFVGSAALAACGTSETADDNATMPPVDSMTGDQPTPSATPPGPSTSPSAPTSSSPTGTTPTTPTPTLTNPTGVTPTSTGPDNPPNPTSTGPTGTGGTGGAPTGMTGSPSSGGTGGDDPVGAGGLMGTGGVEGTAGAGGSDAGGAAGTGGSGDVPAPVNDCPPATPPTGGMQICTNSKGSAGGNYGYELWAEGSGSGCMTVHRVDATFSATWSNVEDFLARIGLDFDQNRTHTQLGTFTAEFAETKEDDGGLTYIGIYGWTVDPLREFYILDDWGSEKPGGFSSDGTPRDEVGTLMADGEIYDVWKKTRENKPSIIGDATFDQYFSIRRTARQCGTISVSEHFRQWEALGLRLGNFHEVKLLLEAQFNSGNIQFSTAKVTLR